MLRNVNILLVLISLSGFSSCSPKMYVPDTVQTPLIEKKGEFQASGYLSPEHFGGWGFAGNYAITKNFFVSAQYFHEGWKNIDSAGTFYRYSFGEGGIGYSTGADQLKWGIIGSAGTGSVAGYFYHRDILSFSRLPKEFNVSARFNRLACTFYLSKLEKGYYYGFGARLSYVSYPSYLYSVGIPIGTKPLYDEYYLATPDVLYVEPCAFMSSNFRLVNFFWQVGLSFPTHIRPGDYATSYPFIMNAGLSFKFYR